MSDWVSDRPAIREALASKNKPQITFSWSSDPWTKLKRYLFNFIYMVAFTWLHVAKCPIIRKRHEILMQKMNLSLDYNKVRHQVKRKDRSGNCWMKAYVAYSYNYNTSPCFFGWCFSFSYCQPQARLKPKRCLGGFIFTLNK